MVTRNKFQSEGSQILDANVQNLFCWAICGLKFLYYWIMCPLL